MLKPSFVHFIVEERYLRLEMIFWTLSAFNDRTKKLMCAARRTSVHIKYPELVLKLKKDFGDLQLTPEQRFKKSETRSQLNALMKRTFNACC